MDFEGQLPATSTTVFGSQPTVVPYNIRNAASLGAEISIEKYLPWSFFRTWAATDVGGVGNAENGRVSSSRGGIDFWLNGDSNISFLVFTLADKIDLYNPIAEDDESQASGVSFTVFFAGGGLAFSW